MISFFAQGIPKGQPRPKAFSRGGHAAVYDPGTAEGWKGQVALAAKDHIKTKLDGPLRVILGFRFPRPSSHYGTKKGHRYLKDSAPEYHTSKPDADNLAKAVMDALTQIGAWHDDSQVCVLRITKMYQAGDTGCHISIERTSEVLP